LQSKGFWYIQPKSQRIAMQVKHFWLILLHVVCPLLVQAQHHESQNPCNDSLFLKLKKIPQASLTVTERKYLEQKEKECAEFVKSGDLQKSRVATDRLEQDKNKRREKVEQDSGVVAAAVSEAEELAPTAVHLKPLSGNQVRKDSIHAAVDNQMEPVLTLRNAGIFAAIVAAVIGIAIALGSVTPSPF
jgi:hypothetical protein